MLDTCQEVLELEANSGREALDEEATRIFHVYRFLCEFENGGLSGFLYNISPAWDDLVALENILTKLNKDVLAKAVKRIEEITRSAPVGYCGTWDDWMTLTDPQSVIPEQDRIIFENYEVLWDELERIAVTG
ncbi:MAG: DMP19 family protein [Roseibacillus sp.]